jgi:hypothetical protein
MVKGDMELKDVAKVEFIKDMDDAGLSEDL